jgi:hypothetical protein
MLNGIRRSKYAAGQWISLKFNSAVTRGILYPDSRFERSLSSEGSSKNMEPPEYTVPTAYLFKWRSPLAKDGDIYQLETPKGAFFDFSLPLFNGTAKI